MIHEPFSGTDQLYQIPQADGHRFEFDAAVARVFADMIERSVPGYAQTLAMAGIITARFAQNNSNLYDLGCSLGAVSIAMRHALNASNCTIIAIDNSQAMLDKAAEYLNLAHNEVSVQLKCADIINAHLERASVSVLNYVLQFVPPAKRTDLIAKIYRATLPGGVLILSEKVLFDEPQQSVQRQLHEDFKRANGYSELEIAQKRSAIEEVLVPELEAVHIERLHKAGFAQVVRWQQCFNFISWLAIK